MPPVQVKKVKCRVTDKGDIEVAGTRYKPGSTVELPPDDMWLVEQEYAAVVPEDEEPDRIDKIVKDEVRDGIHPRP